MNQKVAVIGVGPSGITALKNLLDQGIDAVAFDRNQDVGGNWIYSEDESHSSVFETGGKSGKLISFPPKLFPNTRTLLSMNLILKLPITLLMMN